MAIPNALPSSATASCPAVGTVLYLLVALGGGVDETGEGDEGGCEPDACDADLCVGLGHPRS